MTNDAKQFPILSCDLGEVLFPSSDPQTLHIRSTFTELLHFHVAQGGAPALLALGRTLSTYVPMFILATQDHLRESELKHLAGQRQQIFEALEEFFLNGGEEQRFITQRELLRALERVGVKIHGRGILLENIAYAGNWQKKLVDLIEQGEAAGVSLLAKEPFDVVAAGQIMRAAGFSHFLTKHVLDTATSISLAALETLVHHKTMDLPVQRMLLKLEVPEALWAQRTILNPDDCAGWNAEPASHPSVDYGSAWLRSNAGLLLEVPSVIVPEDKNVIINPHHPDLAAITVRIYRPWVFDSRLKE